MEKKCTMWVPYGQKILENLHIKQTWGSLLMNHPVKENSLKLVKRADLIHENPRYCLCNSSAFRFVVNVDDMKSLGTSGCGTGLILFIN